MNPPMPVISKDARRLTVINVFTVSPDQQARLLELLARATQSSVRHVPGFVSAALHRSLDGTKVTMYAQWRTAEDYQRMRSRSDTSPFLAEAMTLATFDPGLYEVVEVFAPDDAHTRPDERHREHGQ
jgi:quinol monooxygenase YgiN